MKNNETYYGAYRLYILRPSKIIDVEGNFSTIQIEKLSKKIEVVEQDITFKTIPSQIVIAEKLSFDKFRYIPLFEEEKTDEHERYFGYGNYYDQEQIERQGLFKQKEKSGYVGLYPYDRISLLDLPDFEFMQNLGKIGPIKKVKYFNHKKELKPKYHQKLDKLQYTLEDLKKLKQYLIEEVFANEEKEKIIKKSYTVAKEINKPYFHLDTILPSRDTYAGTDEDIDVKRYIKLP